METREFKAFARKLTILANKYRIEIEPHWDECFVLRPMHEDEKLEYEVYEGEDLGFQQIRMRVK